MEKYPKNILKLQTFQGFLEHYQKTLRFTRTYKQAYEETEDEHIKYFGKRKYSDYRSFKVMLSKKKLKNS